MNTVPHPIQAIPHDTKSAGIAPKSCRQWLAPAFILLYVIVAATPLLFFAFAPVSPRMGFWWDFSIGLGFGGVGMMALQFILTARFRVMAAPFGIDILYYFHRWAAITALLLILGHYAVLRIVYPNSNENSASILMPWPAIAGRAALVTFAVMIVISVYRKRINLEYDRWRASHGILAVGALVFTMIHIQGSGYSSPVLLTVNWGLAAFALLALAHIRIVRPWLLSQKEYTLVSVTPERGKAWTVTLRPKKDGALSFKPGQFAWLTLGTSPFKAKEHPFSFSSSAENRKTLQFTIKELGDFTRTVKDISPGTIAYVDGAYGSFSPDFHVAARYVFIAGGVGIAPMMSILRTLADRKDKRELRLIYGSSTWDRILFREEIEVLKFQLDLAVDHVLGEPPVEWKGARGVLNANVLQKLLPEPDDDCIYFVCGPRAMIKAVSRALRDRGVPLRRIYFEFFEMA
jgi:predicted ferric reductase